METSASQLSTVVPPGGPSVATDLGGATTITEQTSPSQQTSSSVSATTAAGATTSSTSTPSGPPSNVRIVTFSNFSYPTVVLACLGVVPEMVGSSPLSSHYLA